jgi:hypothetical protein
MPPRAPRFNAVARPTGHSCLETLVETADETAGGVCCAIYLARSGAFGFLVGVGPPAFQ